MKEDLRKGMDKKVEEAKISMEKQTEQELELYVSQLKSELEEQTNKTEDKTLREVATEKAKLTLQSSAAQKALNSKRAAIQERHNLSKNAIEKEHEIKMRLLPEAKLAESEKLKSELQHQEHLRSVKAKINKDLADYAVEISKTYQKTQKTVEQQLSASRQQYEADISAQIDKIDAEIIGAEVESKAALSLAQETAELEKDTKDVEQIVANRGSELTKLKDKTAKFTQEMAVIEEGVEEYGANKGDVSGGVEDEEEINRLKSELEKKNKQIAELEKIIEKQKQEKPVPRVQESRGEENKVDASQLKILSDKLEEIKQMLGKEAGRGRVSTSQAERQHPVPQPQTRAKRVNQRKMREISLFLNAEKTNLLIFKKSALKDYQVTAKLLQSLEFNRKEWDKELNRSRVGEIHQPVLDELKVNLDRQAEVLSGQINNIKYILCKNRVDPRLCTTKRK